jgi:hypothetical protein
MALYGASLLPLCRRDRRNHGERVAVLRTPLSSIEQVALAYLATGLSVVPIAPGYKAPSIVDPRTGRIVQIQWERYQGMRATPDEVRRWFLVRYPMGLGIVAGAVKGTQVRTYARTCSPAVRNLVRGGEGLRLLFQHLDLALRCPGVLGIPTAQVGLGFMCILPDHDEAHPSASLHWDPKTGALQYRDWHAGNGVEWYTLPDVRASLACGHAVRLRGPSVATWQLRLLVEAWILEPYPVPAHSLPAEVRPRT